MKKLWKRLTAVCLAGMFLTGGVLSEVQPAQAAVTAWSKYNGKYYNSSGKVVPNVVAKGMDVSYWQGLIDWEKVKASGQIEFAFVRVAHGNGMDTYYERNLAEANRVGIPVGVYFYSYAKTVTQAAKDAQTTINAIKQYKITYPVVIDIEDNSQLSLSNNRRTQIVQTFADAVRAAGYQPMVYCNSYWAKYYINMSGLQGVDSWIAEWSDNYTSSISRDIWQVTDKGKVSGINGNVDLDFAFKQYGAPVITAGWVKADGKYKYRLSDGNFVTNEFRTINGKTYYFDSSGYRASDGFRTINGKTYYFGSAGVMKTGLRNINGAKYYFNKNGVMAQNKWVKVNKKRYFARPNGKMKTGWLTWEENRYYLNKSGVMQTGWVKIKKIYYYFDRNTGAMVRSQWVDVNGSRYFVKKTGQMKTGWLTWEGNRYYLKSDGVMRIGWLKYKGKYYYFNESGIMLRNTTVDIDGKSYRFNARGVWKK